LLTVFIGNLSFNEGCGHLSVCQKSGKLFIHLDKGSMATVGRKQAVAEASKTGKLLDCLLGYYGCSSTYCFGGIPVKTSGAGAMDLLLRYLQLRMIVANLRPKDVRDRKLALAETS